MRPLLAFVLCAAPLAAQQASAYLPLDHWATPYVEHLIAAGVMADPAPLTRPLREADVVRALREVDTLATSPAVTRTVHRLLAALGDAESGPRYRIEGSGGVAAATHPLRDPLEIGRGQPPRDPGADRGFVNGGLAVQVQLGALVAVTHPYFDTRLKYDPDYFGKQDRFTAGRNTEAYVDGRWRYGEIFFGSVDRNWGPPALQGLIVSPSPYSYDHLALTVGTARVQLQALLTQLDDFQVDRRTQTDSEPPSYGLTLGARGAARGVAWTAYYTRVANLTYRTPNVAETVERRFVGLGRSFSDYDQATLTASVLAAPG